jgi:hypothetical protein
MTMTAGGRLTLTELILLVRQESDTENDPHVTDPELTNYFNLAYLDLYNKLIESYGDDYYTARAQLTTDGVNQSFALPDGTLYSSAPAFFKGVLVEAISGGNIAPNSPVTLHPFNLREKNRYMRPMSILAVPNMLPRYRIMGAVSATNPTTRGTILFTPLPASGLVVQLWYAPMLTPLSAGSDIADSFSGEIEYAIIDAARRVAQKQERAELFQGLTIRYSELDKKIEKALANRNLGDPNTVVETDGEGGPFGSFGSGPGSWW